MPQAIAAVSAWVATTFAVSAATATFIVNTALSIGLSIVSSKLFGPKIPAGGVGFSGLQTTSRSALEYRKAVYGQAMVSGPIVYNNTAGTNNKDLWYVIALADGESEDFVELWLDGESIPKADIDWTAGTGNSDGTGTGNVSTARWVGDSSATAVNAFYYLGDEDQPVCGTLNTAFTDIGTNNRLRGVTYMAVKLVYTPDTETVWESGPPTDLKAVIKGRKVYDPRKDSTNGGSGSHRLSTPSTWEWSDCPPLCIADYLMSYMDVDSGDIDWTAVADSADDCDVLVEIPPSASPANTQKRFTCNGALSLGATHKDNLEALLSSMDGRLSYSLGKWTMRASVWESSSVSLATSHIIGSIDVRGSAPRSDRFNTVRGAFIDPDRHYEASEFPHVTASEFVSRDNGKSLEYDLELPFTNSSIMAQRIAYRLLEQGDNQIVCTVTLNKIGANVGIGDIVDLTVSELGWSAKTFRVINWERTSDGLFRVTLREDYSESYTDPLVSEYTVVSENSITVPSVSVAAPSNLTATAITSGIRLAWTNPASRLFDWIDVYESVDNSWSNATLVASTRSNTIDITYDSGDVRYYWVRARNFANKVSARDPNSDTSTITASAEESSPGFVRLQNSYTIDRTKPSTNVTEGVRVTPEGRLYRITALNSGPWSESAFFGVPGWWSNAPETNIGDSYQVRLTVNSGTLSVSSSAENTWLTMSTERTWIITTTGGPENVNFTLEIRHVDAASSTEVQSIEDSTVIDITVEST